MVPVPADTADNPAHAPDHKLHSMGVETQKRSLVEPPLGMLHPKKCLGHEGRAFKRRWGLKTPHMRCPVSKMS